MIMARVLQVQELEEKLRGKTAVIGYERAAQCDLLPRDLVSDDGGTGPPRRLFPWKEGRSVGNVLLG